MRDAFFSLETSRLGEILSTLNFEFFKNDLMPLSVMLISEVREDVVEEQEMDNYLMTVMAFQKLLQSERTLMVGIVPHQHQHKVLEIIVREPLDLIVQDCEVSFCF